ncbi:hypothetical protein AAGW05_15850 [Arthrobacter sp. LAPM80]|uniref:DUF7937 domain-containing protein n=1 Tax=Arthrobacter sp. LAPM80 TaxID=3141788 RepID=UPI00398B2EA7
MTYPTPERSGSFGAPNGVPGAVAQSFPCGNPYTGFQAVREPHGGQMPAGSSFAAITVRDYAADAIALTLLVISLFLPWRTTFSGSVDVAVLAASRIDVLLVTILSMLSLGLSYVWRSGAFGPTAGRIG